jgi:hypothetical protein
MRDVAPVEYFKVLSYSFPGDTELNHKKPFMTAEVHPEYEL